MNDNKEPNIKDVAETATKLFNEIKCVVTKVFTDLKTKMSEKTASTAKTQEPAAKTDQTPSPVSKPVEAANLQTPKAEDTQHKPKADDNQDITK